MLETAPAQTPLTSEPSATSEIPKPTTTRESIVHDVVEDREPVVVEKSRRRQ